MTSDGHTLPCQGALDPFERLSRSGPLVGAAHLSAPATLAVPASVVAGQPASLLSGWTVAAIVERRTRLETSAMLSPYHFVRDIADLLPKPWPPTTPSARTGEFARR